MTLHHRGAARSTLCIALACACAAISIAKGVSGQTRPTTAPAVASIPASSQPAYPTTLPAAELSALIQKLDSEDPIVIDDAQKRLVALGTGARDSLRARLAAQDAALGVLADMDRQSLMLPTKITLSVKDLPLDQAAAAISKQINWPITATPRVGSSASPAAPLPHVTIDANGEPFWEVINQLTDQTKTRAYTAEEDGLALRPRPVARAAATRRAARATTAPTTRRIGNILPSLSLADSHICISGSAMTRLATVTRGSTPSRGNEAVSPSILLHFDTLLEPKVLLLSNSAIATITEATDTNGKILNILPSPPQSVSAESPNRHTLNARASIATPPDGATIATVKGTIHVNVGVGVRMLDASAMLKGDAIDLPTADGDSISLSGFTKVDGNNSYTLQFSKPRDSESNGNDSPLFLLVTDDAGKLMVLSRNSWSDSDTRQTGSMTLRPAGPQQGAKASTAKPKSAMLVVYARKVGIDVPFDFKDVPLP